MARPKRKNTPANDRITAWNAPKRRRITPARASGPNRRYKRSRTLRTRFNRKWKRAAKRLPRIGMVNSMYKCRLFTHADFTITTGAAGVAAVQQLYLNDPQLNGFLARQPRQWDVMCNHYKHCCVIGAKVIITNEIQQSDGIRWGVKMPVVYNSEDADYPTGQSLNDLLEDKYIKNVKNAGYLGRLGGGATIIKKVSMKKYFNAKGDMMDGALRVPAAQLDAADNDYWCTMNVTKASGVAPLKKAILNVWVAHADTVSTQKFHASIEYICLFFKPFNTTLPSNPDP